MTAFSLGVVMDPIAGIKIHKDSTFAMLLAAQARGWPLWYMELTDLAMRDGQAHAHMRPLTVRDDASNWFTLGETQIRPLAQLDMVLMRKDPPVDQAYYMATHVLELAQRQGVRVVNHPRALRDANEKLYTAWFAHCCPPTLVSARMDELRAFYAEQGEIILKPLDSMGGASVFYLRPRDPNVSVILETMTHHNQRLVMAQRYVPEIQHSGDKRILMIDGEPVPYALARKPAAGEIRGNLAAGGRGEGVALTARDRWICAQVGPTLRENGLVFVGLDVIGDYLTEINVTSPTCIRELDAQFDLDIAGQLMDTLHNQRVASHS